MDSQSEVLFLRERVVALETVNQQLTSELLRLKREGWQGGNQSPSPSEPRGPTVTVLPAAVAAAIQQRAGLAPGGAQQLLNFAVTALAANTEEADVIRTILNGVSDA
jgi:hypothetical protein